MPVPASEEKQLEWKKLIEEQRQSGLSIQKWCSGHQIGPHTFHYWKDKLFSKQLQKSNFTELNIKRTDTFCLQTKGLYIRMGNDCDPHLRKQLFAIFANLPC